MTDYVYRVVRDDGQLVWEGRGSDPFTRVGSARSRATKLNNENERSPWRDNHKYKVQRAEVKWEDFE